MRGLVAACFLLVMFSGCLSGSPDPGAAVAPFPLDVYRFTWPGADVAVEGVTHGLLFAVHNPGDRTYTTSFLTQGIADATLGPVRELDAASGREAWLPARVSGGQTTAAPPLELAPGEGGVFLLRVEAYATASGTASASARFLVSDRDDPGRPFAAHAVSWNVTHAGPGTAVTAGDHVQTVTVGVWTNGTSFYTNSAALLADPAFPYPASFARDGPTDPLSVYVYGQDGSEQPAASADRCHATTIPGYNSLLKTQAEGSTGVRFLAPEDAYTREGNEGHLLYGDGLVFLNTVVAHDGATGPLDEAPDPTGACFADRLEDLPPVPPQV